MKYENIFKKLFDKIIEDYQLSYITISDKKMALIGKDFALVIMVHLDEVYLDYVIRNNLNQLEGYDVWSYFVSAFDSDDRKGITQPQTVEERVIITFTILSKGLPRHWESILKGSKSWLTEYKKYELADKPRIMDADVSVVLDKLL